MSEQEFPASKTTFLWDTTDFQEKQETHPDLALLLLWSNLGQTPDGTEYARHLSYIIAKHTYSTNVSMACRLWLMERYSDDLGVANTLLGILEREAVEKSSWPPVLEHRIWSFLENCLESQDISVRAAVLSSLFFASDAGFLSSYFPKPLARKMNSKLNGAVASFVDEDEREDLEVVSQCLASADGYQAKAANLRAIERVVLDLQDMQESFASDLPDGITSLINCVREHRLKSDAVLKSARRKQVLQTFRITTEQAPTKIWEGMLSFSEAVIGTQRVPDFEDPLAFDLGTSLMWAPAASFPFHIVYQDDEAKAPFDVFENMVLTEGKKKRVHAAIEKIEPTVARAFFELLKQIKKHKSEVEVLLTDLSSPDWQRSVVLTPKTLGKESLSGLIKRSYQKSSSSGIFLHKENIPQANTVHQVLQAVDAILEKGLVTHADIDKVSSARQVDYYKQGARVLGFLDKVNSPTERARSLKDLSEKERLTITSVFFEDSPLGRAWRVWAGVPRLLDVDPITASEFLRTTVVSGLSQNTIERRASTLRTWFSELMPHYPKTTTQ